ncbi:hypothetical protein Tco_0919313 [Tanacetum coccineum]
MSSHVGSYDGKGVPNNYLHLFEGAIHMQKWEMSIACHMFTYTLKDSTWIWWNGKKTAETQIKEAIKSGQLTHLVKGIKKGKAKVSDTQLGEWKKGDKETIPAKAPILMVNRESNVSKRKSMEEPIGEITFPYVLGFDNSSDPVIIRVQISGRQVKRVNMDSGSSCEVIYEHCFLKLNPSIRSLMIDSKILLVGFSGEQF